MLCSLFLCENALLLFRCVLWEDVHSVLLPIDGNGHEEGVGTRLTFWFSVAISVRVGMWNAPKHSRSSTQRRAEP